MGLTPWRLGDFRWQGSLKDLFGFEIFDFGIFLVTLISGGIVSGYSKLMFLFFVLDYLILSGRFYGSENRHGIFGRFNFGPGICLGFVWIPRVFLAFDFCPHSIISLSWNPEYPPPPSYPRYHSILPSPREGFTPSPLIPRFKSFPATKMFAHLLSSAVFFLFRFLHRTAAECKSFY